MNDRFDLHVHSTASDGVLTPEEVLEEAVKVGLKGLSITDHDTIGAYSDTLFSKAQKMGLILVPGVEFSTEYKGVPVHVLSYFFSLEDERFCEFCKKHQERRKKRNQEILSKLNRLGISISLDDLYREARGTVGRPHIAKLLQKRGVVNSFREAFERFIGDGKPCFVKGEMFSLEETLETIHGAHGKSVLAHPHLLKKKSLVRDLLQERFDGVECYYAKFSEKQNQELLTMALDRNLIPTGGSDFHGEEIKPQNSMGAAYTTLENVRKLGIDQRNSIL